jgi:hypothetical protein
MPAWINQLLQNPWLLLAMAAATLWPAFRALYRYVAQATRAGGGFAKALLEVRRRYIEDQAKLIIEDKLEYAVFALSMVMQLLKYSALLVMIVTTLVVFLVVSIFVGHNNLDRWFITILLFAALVNFCAIGFVVSIQDAVLARVRDLKPHK